MIGGGADDDDGLEGELELELGRGADAAETTSSRKTSIASQYAGSSQVSSVKGIVRHRFLTESHPI